MVRKRPIMGRKRGIMGWLRRITRRKRDVWVVREALLV